MVVMANGKTHIIHEGYAFFFRYQTRLGQKWVCTNFPRCKSWLYIDECNIITDVDINHNHKMKKLKGEPPKLPPNQHI